MEWKILVFVCLSRNKNAQKIPDIKVNVDQVPSSKNAGNCPLYRPRRRPSRFPAAVGEATGFCRGGLLSSAVELLLRH